MDHGHDHGHVGSHSSQLAHSHTHDYAAANREFYDKEAQNYDARPDVAAVTKQITAAMRKAYPDLFDESSTTVMDFACGTGMVSRELIPHVKSIIGVDISGGAVDVYNQRVSELGLTQRMKAVREELKGQELELDGAKFDLIVCSMAYHHFGAIDVVTRTLAFFLKPGGSLLVADRKGSGEGEHKSEAEVPEDVRRAVAHLHGLEEHVMRGVFEGAGLGQFEYRDLGIVGGGVLGKDVRIFITRGVKPLSR
ncbi:hypothetical protein CERSUDRAFT_117945, partial [Gelatoporia subvermispora B]